MSSNLLLWILNKLVEDATIILPIHGCGYSGTVQTRPRTLGTLSGTVFGVVHNYLGCANKYPEGWVLAHTVPVESQTMGPILGTRLDSHVSVDLLTESDYFDPSPISLGIMELSQAHPPRGVHTGPEEANRPWAVSPDGDVGVQYV